MTDISPESHRLTIGVIHAGYSRYLEIKTRSANRRWWLGAQASSAGIGSDNQTQRLIWLYMPKRVWHGCMVPDYRRHGKASKVDREADRMCTFGGYREDTMLTDMLTL
jgi:hypothetical protein